jgi:hypothetical protein
MTLTPDVAREESPSLETQPPIQERPDEATPTGSRFELSLSQKDSARTLPLFFLFIVIGAAVLTFTYSTVHHRTSAAMALNPGVARTNYSVNYWVDHGYFHSGGLLFRPGPAPPGYTIYLSSTGGHLLGGFLAEKIYKAATGHTSVRLLALQNEVVTLVLAALLGLLSFRLARRMGSLPIHAFVLAASVEVVHFTFPDNLALFWELSGRQPFLIFAIIFLLIEERYEDERTWARTLAQSIVAFLLMYMEFAAGLAFLSSFVAVSTILRADRAHFKPLLAITILPVFLALGLLGVQRRWVSTHYPEAPTYGGSFLFRTGLDGSTQYYGSHLDIANRRDIARKNFPNEKYLFRWKWLFLAGTAALLTVLLVAARGRVPFVALLSLLSLLGSYLIYAALFSQAFVIHPYLYDILLYTPLMLALFVITPAFFESATQHRGVFVVVVFFLAAWVSMVQLRDYAMWYPLPPPQETKTR